MNHRPEPYKWLFIPALILFFAPVVAIGNLGYLPPEKPLSWSQFTAFYLMSSALVGFFYTVQLYRLAEKYLRIAE